MTNKLLDKQAISILGKDKKIYNVPFVVVPTAGVVPGAVVEGRGPVNGNIPFVYDKLSRPISYLYWTIGVNMIRH